jgi:hypothetical protein
MKRFKIAHIREQGIDLIIVPLDSAFGRKPRHEQSEIIDSLQACATSAALAGTVVPVWQEGNGHRFIAPQNWHPYFESLSWHDIVANINKELRCG